MIIWIVGGHLVASMVATLVFYAACVAAGRADERQDEVARDSWGAEKAVTQ